MDNLCFWTYSFGEEEQARTLNLISSLKHFKPDCNTLIVSDTDFGKDTIVDPGINRGNSLCKFFMLENILKKTSYDNFVFIDNNSVVKKDFKFETIRPFFCSMEFCINSENLEHFEWYGYPIPTIEKIFKERGVLSSRIYTANSGFFYVKRSSINQVIDLAFDFYDFCNKKGFVFPEDVIMSYISHMMFIDIENATVNYNRDLVGRSIDATDIIEHFNPFDNKVDFEHSPSIINIMRK